MSPQRYATGPYFEVRYGSCTFETGTTKINAWILDGASREFPSKSLQRTRAGHSENADTQDWGDFGKWYCDYLVAEPGTILMVQAERTIRRVPQAGAGIIFRVRPGAAMHQVTVPVTSHAFSRYEQLPIFVGNADIIEYHEARDLHGIQLRDVLVNNWLEDLDEFEEVFTITQLARETQPVDIVRIEGEDGVQGVVVEAPARRRIIPGRQT